MPAAACPGAVGPTGKPRHPVDVGSFGETVGAGALVTDVTPPSLAAVVAPTAWAPGPIAVGDADFNAPDVSSLAAADGLPLGIGAPPTGTVTCVPTLGITGMNDLAIASLTPRRAAMDAFESPGFTLMVIDLNGPRSLSRSSAPELRPGAAGLGLALYAVFGA